MAKKSRPDSLNILGHKIPITYKMQESMPENLAGFFEPNVPMIEIMDCDQWRAILFHEIIHAVLHFTGNSEHLGNLEEGLVTALEFGLLPHVKLKY